MADEVRAVVARVRVPPERVRERVEGRGREAALVDVRERAAEPAEADAEEVEVARRGAELGDERDRVEAAPVVVDLAFDALKLSPIDIVPIDCACSVDMTCMVGAGTYQYLRAFPLYPQ